MKKSIFIAVIFAWGVFFPGAAYASKGILYREANLIGGYSDREGWIGKREGALKNSLGFEYYKKFANEYGDFLTADLQVRLTYDSIMNADEAWGIDIHNAWLEYKAGLGKQIIFGHFDVPFGLEPLLDTHGTLFQTLAMKNLGFKNDWGIGYKGLVGDYDYTIAAQLGSGMSVRSRDGSHLLSGRIGSSRDREFQYGLSLAYGRVLHSMEDRTYPLPALMSDEAVLKKRVGLDAQYLAGPFDFKGEIAYGQNNDEDVVGVLPQIEYAVPRNQNLKFILQGNYWANDLSDRGRDDVTLGIGASYKLSASTDVRLGYFHDLQNSMGEEDKQILLQFYYFGK
ncbi:MAG TPA: hypothetical protein PKV41_00600 [Candidatus Omnitrophota bacterium]|nr:hypothetical protein [Candidatus Omnitrophota bacterium]